MWSRERQEGRQVEHIGGQDEVGVPFFLRILLRQVDGSAEHAPLPMPSRQSGQPHPQVAEALVALRPGLVASGKERVD